MQSNSEFEINDDQLEAVAGGVNDPATMYNGWFVDTQVPCQETPGCMDTVVCCISYGPSTAEALANLDGLLCTYRCICRGCWKQRFGAGIDHDYIALHGWKP